jgi:hypothetical protein
VRDHAGGRDVDRLFLSLMPEPAPVSTTAASVDRLVDRLLQLECYQQAMAQLGLAGPPTVRTAAARSGT